MTERPLFASLLALALGLIAGLLLPQSPTYPPEIRQDIPGCDHRAAWRLAAVEALFTGLPRRPDQNASPLGRALCALPDQPLGEEHTRQIAANPRAYHLLGLRIHAAWTAYVGEQPALPPAEIDRLRRSNIDVRALNACIHRVEWLFTDIPFGEDPIAQAQYPRDARRIVTTTALINRTLSATAVSVCQAALGGAQ